MHCKVGVYIVHYSLRSPLATVSGVFAREVEKGVYCTTREG